MLLSGKGMRSLEARILQHWGAISEAQGFSRACDLPCHELRGHAGARVFGKVPELRGVPTLDWVFTNPNQVCTGWALTPRSVLMRVADERPTRDYHENYNHLLLYVNPARGTLEKVLGQPQGQLERDFLLRKHRRKLTAHCLWTQEHLWETTWPRGAYSFRSTGLGVAAWSRSSDCRLFFAPWADKGLHDWVEVKTRGHARNVSYAGKRLSWNTGAFCQSWDSLKNEIVWECKSQHSRMLPDDLGWFFLENDKMSLYDQDGIVLWEAPKVSSLWVSPDWVVAEREEDTGSLFIAKREDGRFRELKLDYSTELAKAEAKGIKISRRTLDLVLAGSTLWQASFHGYLRGIDLERLDVFHCCQEFRPRQLRVYGGKVFGLNRDGKLFRMGIDP